jgi:hypothetical protein
MPIPIFWPVAASCSLFRYAVLPLIHKVVEPKSQLNRRYYVQ